MRVRSVTARALYTGVVSSFAVPAPRAAGARPPGPSGWARLLGLLFWVVLPLLAAFGLWLGLSTFATHVDNRPPGIPGTYVVVDRSCSGGLCNGSGTFTATDGSFTGVGLWGPTQWAQGTKHSVVYDPSTPDLIVPLPSRWNPTAAITALTGATGLLVLWGWFAFGARRTSTPAPQPA